MSKATIEIVVQDDGYVQMSLSREGQALEIAEGLLASTEEVQLELPYMC